MKEKLALAEAEVARLEHIVRIQSKQIERLLDARDAEQVTVGKLRELITHIYIHSGYPTCGIKDMTTPQKKLFLSVLEQSDLKDSAASLRTQWLST